MWSSLSGLLNASIEMQYFKKLFTNFKTQFYRFYNVPSFALQFSNLLTFQVMELESVMWDIFPSEGDIVALCTLQWDFSVVDVDVICRGWEVVASVVAGQTNVVNLLFLLLPGPSLGWGGLFLCLFNHSEAPLLLQGMDVFRLKVASPLHTLLYSTTRWNTITPIKNKYLLQNTWSRLLECSYNKKIR